ncbi:MAG: hypothetical protein DHS20C11_14110 [Lysobacteraceae bacterium]|nr:MAG: hypothetical protein DHS20C11_14110 [Xanthomonadaceae bacterium]
MKSHNHLLLVTALLASACQPDLSEVETASSPDLPSPMVNPSGRGLDGEVLIRRWNDVIKENGERRRVVYEVGYDYEKTLPFRRMFSADGQMELEEYSWGVDIGSTAEETEKAFELVKADPRLADIMANHSVIMHGGFTYFDPGDPKCGLGSRCLHVFATDNADNNLILQSIVNLVANEVAHPYYDPTRNAENRKIEDS